MLDTRGNICWDQKLEIKNKELLDIISGLGITGKTQSGSLSEQEFNLVFNAITGARQIDNIDDYMNGKVSVERPEPPKAEKTAPEVKKEESKD